MGSTRSTETTAARGRDTRSLAAARRREGSTSATNRLPSVLVGGIAARRDYPPQAAVEIDVVTLDLTRAFVLVEVERPTVVGHLERPVAPADGPEEGRIDAGAGGRLLLSEHRRPRANAFGAPAVRPIATVDLKDVNHLAVRVEEDAPEPRALGRDPRATCGNAQSLLTCGAACQLRVRRRCSRRGRRLSS